MGRLDFDRIDYERFDYERFDFDKEVDRRGTASLKWDVSDGELPMWVADMDFETAPCVRKALEERVAHGVFGYNVTPEEWYEAYQGWWERRHHFRMEKDWMIFCTGVVPALSSIVRKMTTVGENVLIQTPVYNIFFNSIVNNGRNVVQCPLRYRQERKDLPETVLEENAIKENVIKEIGVQTISDEMNGHVSAWKMQNGSGQTLRNGSEECSATDYDIDFEALEEALSNPQTTMMILCNPHNPVGRIWSRDELSRIGELCAKHHVLVVSDEIHCDITEPGKEYVPFAAVSETCRENSITCIAPTKAFNIAGMQTAAVVVPNPVLRHKVWRGLNTDEVAEGNSFAVCSAVAAFHEGEPWLDALREYLFENRVVATEFIKKNLPKAYLVPAEATYLLWLDCRAYSGDSVKLAEFIRKETGLYVSDGTEYGKTGEPFLRINIACPRARMLEGLERLKKGLERFSEEELK